LRAIDNAGILSHSTNKKAAFKGGFIFISKDGV